MRGRLLFPVLLTGALGLALLLGPGAASRWVHAYVVVVAALAVVAAVRELARRQRPGAPSTFDAALARRPASPGRPEDLEQLERYVSIGTGSAFDLHYRLRPALCAIAEGILQGRGIDAEKQPDAARAVLGEQAWPLLRPDRPPPEDREAPTITTGELEAIVAALEGAR